MGRWQSCHRRYNSRCRRSSRSSRESVGLVSPGYDDHDQDDGQDDQEDYQDDQDDYQDDQDDDQDDDAASTMLLIMIMMTTHCDACQCGGCAG